MEEKNIPSEPEKILDSATTEANSKKPTNNTLIIAGSIILSGALIASGIFLGIVYAQKYGQPSTGASSISKITGEDHIYGSPDAKVKLVEYSDLDCPFCQSAHITLKQLVDESGGKVAWIYRHFPLTSLHPAAGDKAMISECVNELAGNDAFWQFLDAYFSQQSSSAGPELAISTAETLGVNREHLQTCYQSGKYFEKVRQQLQEAVDAGGTGTPFTVIVSKGSSIPVSGAQPIETFRTKINPLLK